MWLTSDRLQQCPKPNHPWYEFSALQKSYTFTENMFHSGQQTCREVTLTEEYGALVGRYMAGETGVL
jgi:hypothetical protein